MDVPSNNGWVKVDVEDGLEGETINLGDFSLGFCPTVTKKLLPWCGVCVHEGTHNEVFEVFGDTAEEVKKKLVVQFERMLTDALSDLKKYA